MQVENLSIETLSTSFKAFENQEIVTFEPSLEKEYSYNASTLKDYDFLSRCPEFSLEPDQKSVQKHEEYYVFKTKMSVEPLTSTFSVKNNTELQEIINTSMDDELPKQIHVQQRAAVPKLVEPSQAAHDIFEVNHMYQSTDLQQATDDETGSERCDNEVSPKASPKKAGFKIEKTKSKIVTPENLNKAKKQLQKKVSVGAKAATTSKKSDKKATADHINTICLKLFMQIDKSDLKSAINAVYKDPEVRDLVLSIIPAKEKQTPADVVFSENPTERTFSQIIMTPIENVHRKDELQKKTLSKITHFIYKQSYKFKSKIPKTVAQARMKADFDLAGDQIREGFESTQDEIFERLFGSDRKMGMHNDVVREIITNKKLFDIMLNYDFLTKVVQELDEQTKSDIQTNIVSKFETSSIEELRAAAFSEDGKKKQSFKLPWSRLHNLEAMVTFLEKLYYRADKEKYTSQTNHLRNLFATFQKTLEDMKRTQGI